MLQPRILLLGRKGIVVNDTKAKLNNPNLEIYGGTGINDVRTVFSSHADITHVFMGAGIDIETRLEIIREVCRVSSSTSVHTKDAMSGPEGFLSFVKAIMEGFTRTEA